MRLSQDFHEALHKARLARLALLLSKDPEAPEVSMLRGLLARHPLPVALAAA